MYKFSTVELNKVKPIKYSLSYSLRYAINGAEVTIGLFNSTRPRSMDCIVLDLITPPEEDYSWNYPALIRTFATKTAAKKALHYLIRQASLDPDLYLYDPQHLPTAEEFILISTKNTFETFHYEESLSNAR